MLLFVVVDVLVVVVPFIACNFGCSTKYQPQDPLASAKIATSTTATTTAKTTNTTMVDFGANLPDYTL